jgi:hypothetical protein
MWHVLVDSFSRHIGDLGVGAGCEDVFDNRRRSIASGKPAAKPPRFRRLDDCDTVA